MAQTLHNPFASPTAADLYSRGRLPHPDEVVERIAGAFGLRRPVPLALDVACGTGLSTAALQRVARRVVGTDLSTDMVSHAPRSASAAYVVAPAERLPFRGATFDLLGIFSAFHWLDRDRALAEARRVLRPGGKLVVFRPGGGGAMRDCPEFEQWLRTAHRARYPAPPRLAQFSEDGVAAAGFSVVRIEEFVRERAVTREELVAHLMSHSPVLVAFEDGRETPEETRAWMLAATAPFFEHAPAGTRCVAFHSRLWCLERAG